MAKRKRNKSKKLYVKLIKNGERFWLELIKKDKSKCVGKVSNYLIMNNIPYGSLVKFSCSKIVDTKIM